MAATACTRYPESPTGAKSWATVWACRRQQWQVAHVSACRRRQSGLRVKGNAGCRCAVRSNGKMHRRLVIWISQCRRQILPTPPCATSLAIRHAQSPTAGWLNGVKWEGYRRAAQGGCASQAPAYILMPSPAHRPPPSSPGLQKPPSQTVGVDDYKSERPVDLVGEQGKVHVMRPKFCGAELRIVHCS